MDHQDQVDHPVQVALLVHLVLQEQVVSLDRVEQVVHPVQVVSQDLPEQVVHQDQVD